MVNLHSTRNKMRLLNWHGHVWWRRQGGGGVQKRVIHFILRSLFFNRSNLFYLTGGGIPLEASSIKKKFVKDLTVVL